MAMQKLMHKAGGMVDTCKDVPLPLVEVAALCTAFAVGTAKALYMLTGVITGVRPPLFEAAAPSVHPGTGACVKLSDTVLLAASVWLCCGRLLAVSGTVTVS